MNEVFHNETWVILSYSNDKYTKSEPANIYPQKVIFICK